MRNEIDRRTNYLRLLTRQIGTASDRRSAIPWRGYFLPFRFEIEVDDERYPHVKIEVRSSPEPRIVGVRVHARGAFPSEMTIDPSLRLPLRRWFDQGLRATAAPRSYYERTAYSAVEDDPVRSAIFEELAARRGPQPKSDEFYEEVSHVAVANPNRRTEAITERIPTRFGTQPVPRTVQHWLQECRKRGLPT